MSDNSSIEQATVHLEKAIEKFEAAIVRNRKKSDAAGSLESEIEDLRLDRARLAEQLDVANSRIGTLQQTSQSVSGRLDTIMDNIRLLLSGV